MLRGTHYLCKKIVILRITGEIPKQLISVVCHSLINLANFKCDWSFSILSTLYSELNLNTKKNNKIFKTNFKPNYTKQCHHTSCSPALFRNFSYPTSISLRNGITIHSKKNIHVKSFNFPNNVKKQKRFSRYWLSTHKTRLGEEWAIVFCIVAFGMVFSAARIFCMRCICFFFFWSWFNFFF